MCRNITDAIEKNNNFSVQIGSIKAEKTLLAHSPFPALKAIVSSCYSLMNEILSTGDFTVFATSRNFPIIKMH
jgi:hypothetical protein